MFDTPKLLNINDITKRIGNFFKLPIQLFQDDSYPELALIMVLMIYGAFLRLRRTQPNKQRGFRVPGGNVGKWVVTILGMGGALLALVLSYLPPSKITTGSPVVYIGILLLGVAVFVALPLIVYALRKPSWRNPDAHFYPFDWQIEGRKPWEVSKWKPGYVPTEQEVDDAETTPSPNTPPPPTSDNERVCHN